MFDPYSLLGILSSLGYAYIERLTNREDTKMPVVQDFTSLYKFSQKSPYYDKKWIDKSYLNSHDIHSQDQVIKLLQTKMT